jgi:hypothetical protein
VLMARRYFAAVAGDAPSWECWPPKEWALVSKHLQSFEEGA